MAHVPAQHWTLDLLELLRTPRGTRKPRAAERRQQRRVLDRTRQRLRGGVRDSAHLAIHLRASHDEQEP